MTVLGRLALLFVVVPLIELVLLIQLGQVVGLWPTLGLVIMTGVMGAMLARAEGLRVLYQFQTELASGALPGQALLDGISVLVGGAFLLTPGILTDLAGFALLLPFSRRRIQRMVRRRLQGGLEQGTIKVMSMGPGGVGWSGGFSSAGRGPSAGSDPRTRGLDPTKGIVIEAEEE
jgi:UPF0716 protein FxsA